MGFSIIKPYLIIGLASLVLAGGLGLYFKGRIDAGNKAKIEQIEGTLKDYRTWDEADVATKNLDDVQRCVRLGGLQPDCERELLNKKAPQGE